MKLKITKDVEGEGNLFVGEKSIVSLLWMSNTNYSLLSGNVIETLGLTGLIVYCTREQYTTAKRNLKDLYLNVK
jgi:hypothetical protein